MTSSHGFSVLVLFQSSWYTFEIQWNVDFIHYIKKVTATHLKGNFVIFTAIGLAPYDGYLINELLIVHVPHVTEPV